MTPDQTLFHRMDIVEAGWQIVDPILRAWQSDTTPPIPAYDAGRAWPSEAIQMIERDEHQWRE